MKKVKTIMIEKRAAGTAISLRLVMAVGNSGVRPDSLTFLKEY